MNKTEEYLLSTSMLDTEAPEVKAFIQRVTQGARSERQKAVRIYYAVRDGWKYNPYNISFQPEDMRASALLEREDGHCLDKAILMIAACRAVGIPARLYLAKVRNHIAAEKMTEALGTDELVPHGYAGLWLHGRWVKATPAFNKELCDKLGVDALEFDGCSDSLFQEFDKAGGAFMEYLEEYGHFSDVPHSRIIELLKEHYPEVFADNNGLNKEKVLQRIGRNADLQARDVGTQALK